MKKSHLVALLLVVVVTGAGVLFAQVNAALQGIQPYLPTRLEWLAVELNAFGRQEMDDGQFSINFKPIVTDDTIMIIVLHSPMVDREIMNKRINTSRELIKIIAANHGWADWVRIQEEVKMIQ